MTEHGQMNKTAFDAAWKETAVAMAVSTVDDALSRL